MIDISLSTAKQNLPTIMIRWNCGNRPQVVVEAVRQLAAEPPDVPSDSLPDIV